MSYVANDNAVLFSGCNNLENLTILVEFSTAVGSANNRGWSLQLNSYPPQGQFCQMVKVNWFQYIIIVGGGELQYYIQYWSLGSSTWPPGVNPVAETSPWLPCWANDFGVTTTFATGLSGDTLPSGSFLQIELATDSDGGVTTATFTYVDPDGVPQTGVFVAPAVHPINGFQLNFCGQPGYTAVFAPTVPTALIRYSVSSGELSVFDDDTESACVGVSKTGELSNMVYSDINGAPASTVTQSLQQPITGLGPSALNFPIQQVGTASLPQTVTVAVAPGVTLTGISFFNISPDSPQFDCLPAPGEGNLDVQNGLLPVEVWYHPTVEGQCEAQLQISYDAVGSPLVVKLTAEGVAPQLTVSPQGLLFTTKTRTDHTLTLTNTGTAMLTIDSIAFDRPSSFTFATSCNVDPKGVALNPGQQCTITVAYHSTVDETANLVITHNAAGSPAIIELDAEVGKGPSQ